MTKKLSFPDSIKILNESIKKKQAIDLIVEQMRYASEKDAIKAVNDLLIQAAQETGASLYDICFHTIPVARHVEMTMKDYKDMCGLGVDLGFQTEVRLEPVEFDLIHDGGYWKNKYFALKKAMRELIDKKDEE